MNMNMKFFFDNYKNFGKLEKKLENGDSWGNEKFWKKK